MIENNKVNVPDTIILHHSVAPLDNIKFNDFESITKHYVNNMGWSDNPYHYGIEYVDGKVKRSIGRSEDTVGAHCSQGDMNGHSIGVCIVGNWDEVAPPKEIVDEVVKLCKEIRARRGSLPIEPHTKYAPYKTCPGTLFPLNVVRVRVSAPIVPPVHWAEEYFILLNKYFTVSDRRFDEKITRGEVMKLVGEVVKLVKGV